MRTGPVCAADELCFTALYHAPRPRTCLSLVRYTPHTWAVHYVASQRDDAALATVLAHAAQWAMARDDLHYVECLWQPTTRRMPEALLGSMARCLYEKRLPGHRHAAVDAYRLPLVTPSPWAGGRVLDVENVREDDHATATWTAALLALHVDPIVFRADALDVHNLFASSLGERYRRCGATRRRDVLVARSMGQIVAIATVEHTVLRPGLSPLFNGLRFYWIEAGLAPHLRLAAVRGIVEAAARVCRSRRLELMAILDDGTARDDLAALGLAPHAQYRLSILSKDVIPACLDSLTLHLDAGASGHEGLGGREGMARRAAPVRSR